MKKLLLVPAVILAGCGEGTLENKSKDNQAQVFVAPGATVQEINPVTEAPLPVGPVPVPAPVPDPAPVPIPTPVSDPAPTTDSGSSNLILAQNTYMTPEYRYNPTQVTVRGKNSVASIQVQIPQPPKELSPCYNGFVLSETHEPLETEHKYNGWWLIASPMAYTRPLTEDMTYFYWGTQISAKRVGAVPAEFSVSSDQLVEARVDTGYAQLPYQWASRLEIYSGLPRNPDEKCSE